MLDGREHRIRRAAGRGYPDLVRLRAGRLEDAPDAVVLPGSAAEVERVLEICSREGIAVVPFGGGTSVVGGVEPLRGGFERLVSLDLRRLREVVVDRRSLTAELGPGLRGPEAEEALNAQGVTLGHFPQSFEYATIGGFAATRSAGQASSGYGRFDALVTAIGLTAPAGDLRTLETPHSAAGPALRELVVGSEGALGVITRVTARVRPLPERRRYEAWMAAGFDSGAEAVRLLAQADALPDVVRVSDQTETRFSLALSGASGAKRALLSSYLRLRRRAEGCLIVCGWEGEREAVERRRALSARVLRSAGAAALGGAPGRAWERGRYEGPYLRESCSTSVTWPRPSRPPTPGVASATSTRRSARRSAPRSPARGRPGSSSATSRTPTGTAPRSTSLSWLAAGRATRSSSGGSSRPRPARRSSRWAGRSPITTPWVAITPPTWPPRWGSWGSTLFEASRSASIPAGIMNPGKLLPALVRRLTAAADAGTSPRRTLSPTWEITGDWLRAGRLADLLSGATRLREPDVDLKQRRVRGARSGPRR